MGLPCLCILSPVSSLPTPHPYQELHSPFCWVTDSSRDCVWRSKETTKSSWNQGAVWRKESGATNAIPTPLQDLPSTGTQSPARSRGSGGPLHAATGGGISNSYFASYHGEEPGEAAQTSCTRLTAPDLGRFF